MTKYCQSNSNTKKTLFCIPIDNPSKTACIPIAIYNMYGVQAFKLLTFSSDSIC